MKEASLFRMADSNPLVMLTQGQLREMIRQELEAAMTSNCSRAETNATTQNRLCDKPYLTVKEAAELSGFGVSTIRLYVSEGRLKPCQIKSRKTVIARTELDRFLSSGATD
jgi:excisionase family DNA binding protein